MAARAKDFREYLGKIQYDIMGINNIISKISGFSIVLSSAVYIFLTFIVVLLIGKIMVGYENEW